MIYVASLSQTRDIADSLKLELSLEMDVRKKMDILLELAKIFRNSDPDAALSYAGQAAELGEKHNSHEIILLAYFQKAIIYWRKSDYKSAMEFAEKAKKMATVHHNDKSLAEATLIIGRVYSGLGNYEKSSDSYFQALKIFEEIGDSIGTSQALNSIGLNYYSQNNFEKASEYYHQSLSIARKINYLAGIAKGLNNVAATHQPPKDYEELDLYIREAISINKKTGRKLSEGINYHHLGANFREQFLYDSSFYYYNKALNIFKELNTVPWIADCNLELANYYIETGNRTMGLYHAYQAFQLGTENSLVNVIYESAEALHDFYVQTKESDSAYKYIQIHYQMKDSLDLETSIAKLSQLEMMYEFEKIEQEKKSQ